MSVYTDDIELMKKLEGSRSIAYDCTSNKRTIGIGFNMESAGARKVWSKLGIPEDFDAVFNKEQKLSDESANKLFEKTWKWCIKKAQERCDKLNVSYNALPIWHKFILADIVYNTGSIYKWTQVVVKTEPKDVLLEARRQPHEIMDSRVAKIAKNYGFISTVEDAKDIGLEYTKYID